MPPSPSFLRITYWPMTWRPISGSVAGSGVCARSGSVGPLATVELPQREQNRASVSSGAPHRLQAPMPAAIVPRNPHRTVAQRTDGPALNAALARTGLLQLAFCVLLSAGVLLSD